MIAQRMSRSSRKEIRKNISTILNRLKRTLKAATLSANMYVHFSGLPSLMPPNNSKPALAKVKRVTISAEA